MGEVGVDARSGGQHTARLDERGTVVRPPQLVDDVGHQVQDAPGALEAVQGGPVVVEAVEQFGVQRVGVADPLLVVARRRFLGECSEAFAVEAHVRFGDGGDAPARLGVGVLEDAAAHDLERLVLRGGPPLVGDAPDDVEQALQGQAPVTPSDLEVVGLLPRLGGVRGGDRHEEHAPVHCGDCFGQGLGETELRLEVAGRHVAVNQLSRVGDPFVDEDECGAVAFEQTPDSVARAGSGGVVRGDHVVGLAPAQLPREFPPDGVDLGAVVFLGARGRGQAGADDGDAPHVEGVEDGGARARALDNVLNRLREIPGTLP